MIFTALRFEQTVYRLNPTTFAETIFAGQSNIESSTGYQIAATMATLDEPMGVFADITGKTFIAERGGGGIRVVGPNGKIKTVVGYGLNYVPGITGLSSMTPAIQPTDMVLDANGDMYFSDRGDCTIKKVEGPF